MSSIDSNSNVYQSLGLTQNQQTAQGSSKSELGQDAFMQLMLAQLKNQNPLDPMDNGEFLAQMAQFSTASGIKDMNDSFQGFAGNFASNQALQASSLVGRQVVVQSNIAKVDGSGGFTAMAALPVSTSSMQVSIYDQAGQLVRTIKMGPHQAGEVGISWDGMSDDGKPVAPGMYGFSVEADIDGQMQSLNSAVAAAVESVTLGQGGADITLNVAGQGEIPMSRVSKIM